MQGETAVSSLQRIIIKEELMALVETYYGNKQGVHMRAAYLNNLIFWQGIRLNSAQSEKSRIERAIKNGLNQSKIDKMQESYRGLWFWKTSEELMVELMGFCSPSSITRMNEEFKKQGWMEVGRNPDPKKKWDKSTWYKLDLVKINSDLNKLGYHLENFKIEDEKNPNETIIEETAEQNIFHGEKSTIEPIKDVSNSKDNSGESAPLPIFHGESSIFHGESSIFHGESSIFHHGRTIPEGNTEGFTEGELHNVCVPEDEQRIIDLIHNRDDLKTHTQLLIDLLNKKKTNKDFNYGVFYNTLELIDVDIKGINYLTTAIMNNLKKGEVKQFIAPIEKDLTMFPYGNKQVMPLPKWYNDRNKKEEDFEVEETDIDFEAEKRRILEKVQ